MAIAPDGTWLASAGGDGTVRIWDPVTGQQRAALTGHTGAVIAVAIAPDGTWLATAGDDGTVRIWDPATGQQRATLTGHTSGVTRGGDRPGRHLAGHRRRRRDGADLGPGHRPAARHPHRPHRLRWTRWRSPRTAPGSPAPATTGRCGSGTRPPASSAPPSPATPARWTRWRSPPDGTWLASASDDGTVRIWDPATGEQRAALTGHTGAVNAVAIAPDGTWLASAGDDGTVRIWDPVTGQQRAALDRPHRRGERGGDRPGRHLAGQRRRRRDGADLGPGHRPAARRPHRPHRRG